MDNAPTQLQAYATGLLQGTAYSRMHNKLTRSLVPLNVSIPEWKLLGQVYEQKQVRLSDLADLLSYDPPMVTKLVKQLEKKKMVKRTSSRRDERVKIITNTELGNNAVMQAEPIVKEAMNLILKGITRDELLTYVKVLGVIVQNTGN